jgi:hypothetical protein
MIGIDPGISMMAKSTINAANISLVSRCIFVFLISLSLTPHSLFFNPLLFQEKGAGG